MDEKKAQALQIFTFVRLVSPISIPFERCSGLQSRQNLEVIPRGHNMPTVLPHVTAHHLASFHDRLKWLHKPMTNKNPL
jgi:hypothetical protein